LRLRKSIDDIKDDMKRRKMYNKIENRSFRTRNALGNKSISSVKALEEMLQSNEVDEFSMAQKIPDKNE